jgi:hypothetical protein
LTHYGARLVYADTPVLPLRLRAMTLFLCNTLLVAGVLGRVTHQSVASVWRRCHLCTFPYYLFGSIAAALVVHAHLPQSWLASFLVIPAMYLAHRFWSQVVGDMRATTEVG